MCHGYNSVKSEMYKSLLEKYANKIFRQEKYNDWRPGRPDTQEKATARIVDSFMLNIIKSKIKNVRVV